MSSSPNAGGSGAARQIRQDWSITFDSVPERPSAVHLESLYRVTEACFDVGNGTTLAPRSMPPSNTWPRFVDWQCGRYSQFLSAQSMRKELGDSLLTEPFLILLSYGFRPLLASCRVNVLRAMLGGTGGANLQFRDAAVSSSSTRTTIQTPIWPLIPTRGVQCIHRPRPSS